MFRFPRSPYMWNNLIYFTNIVADRICATARFEDQCSQLQRGNSYVNCQRVQDGIDCVQRLRNGTAEFGVFSAESALLLATLRWDGLTAVRELRHRDRLHRKCREHKYQQQRVYAWLLSNFTKHCLSPSPDEADFESVVVVRSNHKNGIEGLKGLNFCHPGLFYDRTERWSERFLKHFERNVVTPECENKQTWSPAEIEVDALAKLFSQACRPGSWSNDVQEDARLSKIKCIVHCIPTFKLRTLTYHRNYYISGFCDTHAFVYLTRVIIANFSMFKT